MSRLEAIPDRLVQGLKEAGWFMGEWQQSLVALSGWLSSSKINFFLYDQEHGKIKSVMKCARQLIPLGL